MQSNRTLSYICLITTSWRVYYPASLDEHRVRKAADRYVFDFYTAVVCAVFYVLSYHGGTL